MQKKKKKSKYWSIALCIVLNQTTLSSHIQHQYKMNCALKYLILAT